MFFNLLVTFGAFFGNTLLSLFTFIKNPKSATNRLFLLFAESIAVYILINFLALQQTSSLDSLFWIRLVMLAALLINLFFLLLTVIFPHTKIQIKPWLLWAIILSTVILLPITQTPLLFKSSGPHAQNPVSGPGIILFTLHTVIFLGGGFIILILKFRRAKGIEKSQILLFMIGGIIMFGAILITNLLFVVLLQITAFVGLLPIYTIIFVGFISYAIVKHKFLDINLIVARSVVYTLVLTILAVGYTFFLLFVGARILKIPFTTTQYVFYGILVLLSSFAFQPLRRRLETFTDKIFYKGYYDSEKLLKSLSDIMASTIELKPLTGWVLERLLITMHITKGVFVLLKSKDHGTIEYIESNGFAQETQFKQVDIDLFLTKHTITIFDDLEEEKPKKTMRSLEISAALPLMINEEKIGVLFLGEKSSGDIYSEQDIKVMEILAPELTVAIQNSKKYEEIKRFNITLKEEVERATKHLQDANERLKSLDKLKDEFVSLASHELRTPMTAIKSYLWLVLKQKGVGDLNEKQRLYLDRTYQSTERLIKLVNDMLNVSRIESGRLTISKKPTNLVQLAQDAVNDILPAAQKQNIMLTVTIPKQNIPQINADQEKIKEVLINLIGNSLKFTPSAGSIKISFLQKNNMIETNVTDTGTGIKPEDIEKLFHKFSMIEGNYGTRPLGQGSGLGLYISKSIIELHGGKITVFSEGINKGTTFTFTLPIKQEV